MVLMVWGRWELGVKMLNGVALMVVVGIMTGMMLCLTSQKRANFRTFCPQKYYLYLVLAVPQIVRFPTQ